MKASMKKSVAGVALAAALFSAVPLAPAHADGWRHGGYGGGWHEHGGGWGRGGHGDHEWGLFAGVAAITGAAVAVATLPFRAVEEIAAPPPVYSAPPQQAYYNGYYEGYAPAYPQRRVVVYSYPQPYPYAYAYPQYPPQ